MYTYIYIYIHTYMCVCVCVCIRRTSSGHMDSVQRAHAHLFSLRIACDRSSSHKHPYLSPVIDIHTFLIRPPVRNVHTSTKHTYLSAIIAWYVSSKPKLARAIHEPVAA